QVIGATTLLSAADRLPPRAAIVAVALVFAIGTAVQSVPGLPVGASFAVLLVLGLAASPVGGIRYGLLNEILAKDGYLLGRSLINMAVGITQIAGFAVGGVLVTLLTPEGTLLTAALLYGVAAVVARFGLTRRAPRAAGRPSVAETWRGNALLWSDRSRRIVFLALWIPNGLIVGCESLFVSYAPGHAGTLLAAAALGMLAGDVVFGRFVPSRWRPRLGVPLLLLLALPYLLFLAGPPPAVVVGAVAVASVGYAASLVQQEKLMALTPEEHSGQALGLHASGMTTMQGVAAALAGTAAQFTSPATAMAIMAVASVAVTLTLAKGLGVAARRTLATAEG
ncbi:MAG: MFS transporter, partial [Nonomuraea sp.]|nr:MFS transporter [Nonomuraea sp.]